MMFLARAAFWLVVVGMFMPTGETSSAARPAPLDIETLIRQGAGMAVGLCANDVAGCLPGAQSPAPRLRIKVVDRIDPPRMAAASVPLPAARPAGLIAAAPL